jgi:hypothetical protein
MRRFTRLWLLLSSIPFLSSCNLYAQPSGTMAWIDAPLDDLQIPLGQTVTVEGHAASATGIERIEFWVGEELLLTQSSPDQVGSLSRLSLDWSPSEPGTYTIQMVAYSTDGSISPPDTITLHVGQSQTSPTRTTTSTLTPESTVATPTLTPTPSPTLITPTVTSTWVPPSVTPTLTPPPDTTGPAAPMPISPAGKVILDCTGNTTLNWSAVSDPSGISQYSVELQRHSGDNKWTGASGSPFGGIGGTSTGVSVDCGWYYRWRVRARDGAGNWGSYSSWAEFAITLG